MSYLPKAMLLIAALGLAACNNPDRFGAGGAGEQSSLTGTATYYAAGGGGRNSVGNQGAFGTGWAGAANTGNGGAPFAQGWSGVVVIAYPDTYAAPNIITGTYTTPTRSGYRVYQFTGSGSIKW